MSDKTENNEVFDDGLDDLDIDLDDSDIDIDIDGGKDDRSVVKKVSSGFTDGVKSDLSDPSKIARRTKAILPSSYESSFEAVDKTATTAGELYNTVIQETRQGRDDFKRASQKLLDANSDKIPKGIKEKLDGFLKVEEKRKEQSKDELREESISNELGSIFATQIESNQEIDNQQASRENVKEALAGKRHESELSVLQNMQEHLAKQTSYQDRITARYQKKSLELKYRQLFVSKDILSILSESLKDVKEGLSNIVTNTSLPEYRKLQLMEASGQNFRDALLGKVQSGAVDFGSNFVKKLTTGLKDKVTSKAKDYNEQLSSAAGQLEQILDASGDDSGIDKAELAGSLGADFAMAKASGVITPKLREWLEKNQDPDTKVGKAIGKLQEVGLKAQRGIAEAPRKISEWANGQTDYTSGFGPLGLFEKTLRETVNETGATFDASTSISAGQKAEDSFEPAIFDNLTRKSIVEIIPGFLSRIHEEVRQHRIYVGADDPEQSNRMEYDLLNNNFSSKQDKVDSVKDFMFDKGEKIDKSTQGLYSLANQIDEKGELSEEAYKGLVKKIASDFLEGRNLSELDLAEKQTFNDLPESAAEEITSLIRRKFDIKEEADEETGEVKLKTQYNFDTQKDLNKLTSGFNDLTRSVYEPKAQIEALTQMGSVDELLQLGLVKRDKDGKLEYDREKLIDVYTNNGFDNQSSFEDTKKKVGIKNYEDALEKKRQKEEEEKYKLSRSFNKGGDVGETVKKSAKKAYEGTKDAAQWTQMYAMDKQVRNEFNEQAANSVESGINKVSNFTYNKDAIQQGTTKKLVDQVFAFGDQFTSDKDFRSDFYTRQGENVKNAYSATKTYATKAKTMLSDETERKALFDRVEKMARDHYQQLVQYKDDPVKRKQLNEQFKTKVSSVVSNLENIDENDKSLKAKTITAVLNTVNKVEESFSKEDGLGKAGVNRFNKTTEEINNIVESSGIGSFIDEKKALVKTQYLIKQLDPKGKLSKEAKKYFSDYLQLVFNTALNESEFPNFDTKFNANYFPDNGPRQIIDEIFNVTNETQTLVSSGKQEKEDLVSAVDRAAHKVSVNLKQKLNDQETDLNPSFSNIVSNGINKQRTKDSIENYKPTTFGGLKESASQGYNQLKENVTTQYKGFSTKVEDSKEGNSSRAPDVSKKEPKKSSNTTSNVYGIGTKIRDMIPNLDFDTSNKDKLISKIKYGTMSSIEEMGGTLNSGEAKETFENVLKQTDNDIIKKVLEFDKVVLLDKTAPGQYKDLPAAHTLDPDDANKSSLLINTTNASVLDPMGLSEIITHEHTHLKQTKDNRLDLNSQSDPNDFWGSKVGWEGDYNYPVAQWLLPGEDYVNSEWEKEAYEAGWNKVYDSLDIDEPKSSFIKRLWSGVKDQINQMRPSLLENMKSSFLEQGMPWYYDDQGKVNLPEDYTTSIQDAPVSNTSVAGIANNVSDVPKGGSGQLVQNVDNTTKSETILGSARNYAEQQYSTAKSSELGKKATGIYSNAKQKVTEGIDQANGYAQELDAKYDITNKTNKALETINEKIDSVIGTSTQKLDTSNNEEFLKQIISEGPESVIAKLEMIGQNTSVEVDSKADEAKIGLLQGILENVNFIAQHLSEGDKESWLNVKDLTKKAGRTSLAIGKSFGKFYAGAFNMFGGGLSGIGSVLKGGGRSVGKLVGNLVSRNKLTGAIDIYNKDSDEPVLYAKKMKNGEYFDSETGESITTYEDLMSLEGDVMELNEKNIPNIVLSASDIKEGIFDRQGNKLSKPGMFSKLGSTLSSMSSAVFAPTRMLLKGLGKIKNVAKYLINRQTDIYVKGETTPRMLLNVMKKGGYVSSVTGKIIRNYKDIDGDVLDRNGNVVLSLDEMREGLVDRKGNSLSFLTRQIDRVKSVGNGVLKGAKWAAKSYGKYLGFLKDKTMGAASGIGSMLGLGGKNNSGELSQENAESGGLDPKNNATLKELKTQSTILKDMRKLMRNQYSEDDPLRKGSWQEKLSSEDSGDKTTNQETNGRGVRGKGGLLGVAGMGMSALSKMFSKNEENTEDEDGGDTTIMGGMFGGGKNGKPGMLKRAGGAALKGLKTAATLATGAGSWLLRGAMMAGSALAGAVSLPVIAASAAVIGAGVGIYYGYKYFTKITIGDFTKLRLEQYGIRPEDEDNVNTIFYLEDELSDYITKSQGNATLRIEPDDLKEILSEFLDLENESQVEIFKRWFKFRFVPVFLTHVSGLNQFDIDLDDVDDDLEDPQDKLAFLSKIKDPSKNAFSNDSVYRVTRLGFGDPNRVKGNSVADIENIISALDQKFKKELDKDDMDSNAKTDTTDKKGEKKKEDENGRGVPNPKSSKPTKSSKVTKPTPIINNTSSNDTVSYSEGENFSDTTDELNGDKKKLKELVPKGKKYNHKGNGPGGNVNDLPDTGGQAGWSANKELIATASKMAGVDPSIMATMAAIESNFNPNAKAKTSSATGLYQFINSTWNKMIKMHGDKYGLSPNSSPLDPKANALMGAEFLKGNYDSLKRGVGPEVTDTDMYLAHFLGAGGAINFLKNPSNERADRVNPAAARANRGIFYNKGNPRSLGDVYNLFDDKVSKYRDRYSEEAKTIANNVDLKGKKKDNVVSLFGKGVPPESDTEEKDTMASPNLDSKQIPIKKEKIADSVKKDKPSTKDNRVALDVMNQSNSTTPKSSYSLPIAPMEAVKLQNANLRDSQGKKDNQVLAKDMKSMITVLAESLTVQRSMDSRLDVISQTLMAQSNVSDEKKEEIQKANPAPKTGIERKTSKEVQSMVVKMKKG